MTATLVGVVQQQYRRSSGAAGAPPLHSGQIFSNESEAVVYIGVGDDGTGMATSAVKIGGATFITSLIAAALADGSALGALFANLPATAPDGPGKLWLDEGVVRVTT